MTGQTVEVGFRVQLTVTPVNGDQEQPFLVPAVAFTRYHDEFGVWPQEAMLDAPQAWAPWLAWWTLHRGQADKPEFAAWYENDVDWIEAEFVPSSNPFGSGAAPKRTSSPRSPSGRATPSKRSSASPTGSKKRSGVK